MVKTEFIRIFDTTLRDGEQAPGASLQHAEKLQIAVQLEKLGVDVIEAGFPVASPDDFRAVQAIAKLVTKSTVCGLSRAVERDIATCFEAIAPAKQKRIHTFLATSDLHLEYKLKMTRAECLEKIEKMVRFARKLCRDVEFSAEDASRTEPKFLYQALEAAIRAGAQTVNIPDTVGYAYPAEFGALIANIKKNVRGIDDVTIAVHCHDDLGLATANALAAVKAGARQIECTINGLGERAGNTPLEEVVMALRTRGRDTFAGLDTKINAKELTKTSRLVSQLTGFPVPPNKAIVGSNAFAHESGIHQHGILAKRETYEILRAEDVGCAHNRLVLGKHSGRAALAARLAELGFHLDEATLATTFEKFKKLADQKKEIFDEDLEILATGGLTDTAGFQLKTVAVTAGNRGQPTAAVTLQNPAGKTVRAKTTGTGPVDAAYRAINDLVGESIKLLEFGMQAVTAGIDAQAVVTVKVASAAGRVYTGRSGHTDMVVASCQSYLIALNKILAGKQR